MTENPRGWLDPALRLAALWAWGVTGAFFWGLAESRDAVLPYVPRALWALPGWSWSQAPVLAIALLAGGTLLSLRPPGWLAPPRLALIVVLVVVAGVALVWGGALLVAPASPPNSS